MMILNETIFKPRPSGAAVCTTQCVVKLTRNALEESQALLASLDSWTEDVRPVHVYAVTQNVLVLEKVEVTAQFSFAHLDLHLNARHYMDSLAPRNVCTEAEYLDYCWSEDPDHPEFQDVMKSLSKVVANRIQAQEPCYVHGDFTLSNTIPTARSNASKDWLASLQLRIIDVSFKPHPPVCAVDYAKALFSVLGFDVPYSKENADHVIHAATARCSKEELAYFLASHVLRVSRREKLSKDFVRSCWKVVSTLVRESGVRVQRQVDRPVEVLSLDQWKALPYPDFFLSGIEKGDGCPWYPGARIPMFVFDMDGTLVDSKDATVAAYREAGFDFKTEYWGKSASDLKIPAEQHKHKQDIWGKHWRKVKLTPLMPMVEKLRESMNDYQRDSCFHIITGASEGTVKHTRKVLERKNHWNFPLRGASAYDKQEFLWYWSRYYSDRAVYYFDDNREFLEEASKNIASTNLIFIHYNGETV